MIAIPDPSRTSLTETATEALSATEGEKLTKYFVVVTHIDRRYGGPQEGGWYYDWHTNEDVRKVFGEAALLSMLEKLGEEYPRSRYKRSSVLGTAGDYEFTVCTSEEEFPPETTRAPTYE